MSFSWHYQWSRLYSTPYTVSYLNSTASSVTEYDVREYVIIEYRLWYCRIWYRI